MRSKALICAIRVFLTLLALSQFQLANAASGVVEKGSFRFSYGDRGVSGLANPGDPFGAQVTAANRPLMLAVRYKAGAGDWKDLNAEQPRVDASPQAGTVRYTLAAPGSPLKVMQTFKTDGSVLDWDVALETTTKSAVTIGDLAINVPVIPPRGEEPKAIFERSFVRHQFISGHGSFLYFVRPSGAPPFLIVTVHPGTKLEYFTNSREGTLHYIHSGLSGNNEKRGTWRQEHTFLKLGPAGANNNIVRG